MRCLQTVRAVVCYIGYTTCSQYCCISKAVGILVKGDVSRTCECWSCCIANGNGLELSKCSVTAVINQVPCTGYCVRSFAALCYHIGMRCLQTVRAVVCYIGYTTCSQYCCISKAVGILVKGDVSRTCECWSCCIAYGNGLELSKCSVTAVINQVPCTGYCVRSFAALCYHIGMRCLQTGRAVVCYIGYTTCSQYCCISKAVGILVKGDVSRTCECWSCCIANGNGLELSKCSVTAVINQVPCTGYCVRSFAALCYHIGMRCLQTVRAVVCYIGYTTCSQYCCISKAVGILVKGDVSRTCECWSCCIAYGNGLELSKCSVTAVINQVPCTGYCVRSFAALCYHIGMRCLQTGRAVVCYIGYTTCSQYCCISKAVGILVKGDVSRTCECWSCCIAYGNGLELSKCSVTAVINQVPCTGYFVRSFAALCYHIGMRCLQTGRAVVCYIGYTTCSQYCCISKAVGILVKGDVSRTCECWSCCIANGNGLELSKCSVTAVINQVPCTGYCVRSFAALCYHIGMRCLQTVRAVVCYIGYTTCSQYCCISKAVGILVKGDVSRTCECWSCCIAYGNGLELSKCSVTAVINQVPCTGYCVRSFAALCYHIGMRCLQTGRAVVCYIGYTTCSQYCCISKAVGILVKGDVSRTCECWSCCIAYGNGLELSKCSVTAVINQVPCTGYFVRSFAALCYHIGMRCLQTGRAVVCYIGYTTCSQYCCISKAVGILVKGDVSRTCECWSCCIANGNGLELSKCSVTAVINQVPCTGYCVRSFAALCYHIGMRCLQTVRAVVCYIGYTTCSQYCCISKAVGILVKGDVSRTCECWSCCIAYGNGLELSKCSVTAVINQVPCTGYCVRSFAALCYHIGMRCLQTGRAVVCYIGYTTCSQYCCISKAVGILVKGDVSRTCECWSCCIAYGNGLELSKCSVTAVINQVPCTGYCVRSFAALCYHIGMRCLQTGRAVVCYIGYTTCSQYCCISKAVGILVKGDVSRTCECWSCCIAYGYGLELSKCSVTAVINQVPCTGYCVRSFAALCYHIGMRCLQTGRAVVCYIGYTTCSQYCCISKAVGILVKGDVSRTCECWSCCIAYGNGLCAGSKITCPIRCFISPCYCITICTCLIANNISNMSYSNRRGSCTIVANAAATLRQKTG